MIDKELLRETVDKALEGTGCFPVEIKVTPANEITVEIDSMESVDIDRCIALTRAIEAAFDRDAEDYELEVGSSGLTSEFKDPRQWLKNVGNEIELLTADGRKMRATLTAADEEGFTIEYQKKVRKEGEKRPTAETVTETLPYTAAKSARYHLEF